jgi:hypothetical protein
LLSGAVLATACIDSPDLKRCFEFSVDAGGCPIDCELYCAEVLRACPSVYSDEGVCLTDCRDEPVTELIQGEFPDRSGDSLACRLTYLEEGQCTEASLLESTQCRGTNACPEYCELMLATCPQAFPNEGNCLSSCATLPTAADDADRNSQECRLKYARQAEEAGGDEGLCNAASYPSDGRCGTACETYCFLTEAHCADTFAIYEDPADCQTVCSLMNSEGRYDDWSEDLDTVQCRVWHVGPPALQNPSTHCKHGRVYNQEQCGADPCQTYCTAVLQNCTGVYPDFDTCLQDCPNLPEFQSFDPNDPRVFPEGTQACPPS